jgi:hypothetical protein
VDEPESFSRALADWTDWDFAGYRLGRSIGLFAGQNFHIDVKHVFWTSNPLGDGLHDALLALVLAGVVERRDEPDEQFRWKA